MRKRKVLMFFGALLMFSLILGAMNLYNPGSVTAKAIDSSSSGELFVGSVKGISLESVKGNVEGSKISLSGKMRDIIGEDHNIELTVYAVDSQGVTAGQHKSSMFLAAGDRLNFAANFNHDSAYPISELIFYIDDGQSVIKGAYSLGKKGITGNVVGNMDAGAGLVIYALLLASGIFFTVRYFSAHRKQLNLATALGEGKSRQFIDIDIR